MSTYREHRAASQSLLKALEGHPKYAKYSGGKKSKSLDIGSIVDTMLTNEAEFKELYEIYYSEMPTAKMKEFADAYVSLALSNRHNQVPINHIETVLTARTMINYDGRLGTPKILEKFDNDCYDYVNFVIDHPDKLVIGTEDFVNCTILADSAREKYPDWFYPTDYVEILFQKELYFEYSDSLNGEPFTVELKALPDIIRINHIDKTIEIADVKTFADDFVDNYWKYKYYYQAEFYLYAIIHYLNELNIPDDYTVKDFWFIAIDTTGFKGVEMFKHNASYHTVAWSGGRLYDNRGRNVQLKGLKQLIKEYYYHSSTGNWEHSFELLTKGYILL